MGVLNDAISALSPKYYYLMDDASLPLVDSGSGANNCTSSGGFVSFQNPSMLPTGEGLAVAIGSNGYFVPAADFVFGTSFTFMFPVKFATTGAAHCAFSQYNTSASYGGVLVGINSSGIIYIDGKVNGSGTYEQNTATTNVCDGNTHWISVVCNANVLTAYLDGAVDSWTVGGSFNGSVYAPAAVALIGQINAGQYWNGYMQNFAFWDTALTSTQVANISAAALNVAAMSGAGAAFLRRRRR